MSLKNEGVQNRGNYSGNVKKYVGEFLQYSNMHL